MTHKIDIIIPCHNHARLLDECLERVTGQTLADFSVLLMDDASTDDTAALAARWMARDSRIRHHRNDSHLGTPENMRNGYELTTADYVIVLHPDDLWEPEFLAKTCAALDQNPPCAYAWSAWGDYRRPRDPLGKMAALPHAQSGVVDDAPFLILVDYIPTSFFVFRRAACGRAGGLFPRQAQRLPDLALKLRLAAEGPGYFINRQLGRRRAKGEAQKLTDAQGSLEDLLLVLDEVFEAGRWPKPLRLLAKARQIQLLTGEKISVTARAFGGETTPESMRDFVEADRYDFYLLAALVIRGYPEAPELTDTAGDADDLLAEILDNAPEDSAFNLLGGKPELRDATDWRRLNKTYAAWQDKRGFVPGDITHIEQGIAGWKITPRFQILLRVGEHDKSRLADTLDSLNRQFYGNWRVDIVTAVEPPAGIEEIANLGWHVVTEAGQHKAALDLLIASERADWIIELPAGAALDRLCLWRIADEADRRVSVAAFYVDDDVIGVEDERIAPRFKSELNVEWCRSMDLIGPLFVKRAALRAAGGLAASAESPWYDLLLRLIETAGREAIAAIPDVLLSYPEAFPSSRPACMSALAEHLTRLGENADVMPITGNTWRVIHHRRADPLVSILIPASHTLEMMRPCIDGILERTAYANYELIVVADADGGDAETRQWLAELPGRSPKPVRIINSGSQLTRSAALNLAAQSAAGEYLLLLGEDTRVLQDAWLDELLAQAMRPGVAVTPRLAKPQSGLVENAGYVLGMGGLAGAPGRDKLKFSSDGYLKFLQVCREISAAPAACLMLAKEDYLAAGGMDASLSIEWLAAIDFSLKLRESGKRLIYTPFVTVAHYGHLPDIELGVDPLAFAENQLTKAREQEILRQRWGARLLIDPLWSPNLSLSSETVAIETLLWPNWRCLPGRVPRFLTRHLSNGQGIYRITQPLRAARQAGLAQECLAVQSKEVYWPAELARCGADVVIVNLFAHESRLTELRGLRRALPEAFIVYACDDLVSDMPLKSVFRKNIHADARRRYRTGLKDCDRLVVTTPYLAEISKGFIDDIRIVPNRLNRDVWLPLVSRRRTGKKPRIGWAGGSGHQGDLELLQAIVEATRDEADWIFFGMCPKEIRPLIAEFPETVPFSDYPEKLASLNFDIAVAPLEDHPFNYAKSNLRLLEYGVLGLPVVCSDVPSYRDTPAKRVANTPQAWIAALRERIHDPDAAEREGDAMKEWVLRDYILEDHLDDWLNAHLPDGWRR